MMKALLRTLVGIGIATLVFGTPPAYAIFGIRAARTAIAARKAKQMTSSSSPTPEEAYAQEKAKFGEPVVKGNKAEGQQKTQTAL